MSQTKTNEDEAPAGLPVEAREYVKQAFDQYTSTRRFEAASRRPRTSGWVTGNLSPNSELARALPLLRERSSPLPSPRL